MYWYVCAGIGNIANAIIGGMSTGPFEDTYVWTEVLQDTFLDFFGMQISLTVVMDINIDHLNRSRQIDIRFCYIRTLLPSRLREILQ